MMTALSSGQYVSDWVLVRFGTKFRQNKFYDGSWVEQPGFFKRLWRRIFG
jgi:hypothetical protein